VGVIGMAARRPGKPRFRARFGRWGAPPAAPVAAWLLRRTRGRVLRLWRRRVVLLTTCGRRSGRLRTVPCSIPPTGRTW
jgi:hypothetical protein